MSSISINQSINANGFTILENIYSKNEVNKILDFLKKSDVEKSFGIRYFLKTNPQLVPLLFNEKLRSLIKHISPKANIIKSIYFDKPPNANWIVNWHQDLTINLEEKKEIENFKNWRVLKDRTVVQPPLSFLENIFTIRIHLDKCTVENGALRVVKKSHLQGVVPLQGKSEELSKQENICAVNQGGILIMKPLIFHSSKRTENNQNRRVIHIEFCDQKLPSGLQWKEFQKIALIS